MKSFIITTLLVLSTALIPVYEAGKIVPKYYAQETPSGEIKIYSTDQILVPKLIIKPDGRIYPAGSIVPKYRIPLYREREDLLKSPGFSGFNREENQ